MILLLDADITSFTKRRLALCSSGVNEFIFFKVECANTLGRIKIGALGFSVFGLST